MSRARDTAGIIQYNQIRFDSNNAVGIGSSIPDTKLDVNGGMRVTGIGTFENDVQIADKIVHTGDTNTAIRFPAADTFTVETGGSERIRITSAGDVSIGVTSPLGKLHVRAADECNFVVREESTSLILSAETNSGRDNNRLLTLEGAGLVINSGGNEKLRVTSGGEVIVNGTAAGSNAKFEVQSTTGSISSATLRVSGEKTTTGAINTGSTIILAGHDGGNSCDFASLFAGKENGTASNFDAYLAFGTRSNGNTLAERLRITSAGQVLIATTTVQAHPNMDDLQIGNGSGNRGITISSGTSNFGTVAFGDSADGSGTDRYSGFVEYYHDDDTMRFGTGSTARLTISSEGADFSTTGALKVPVGTTAQRPTGAAGDFRYNSETGGFEGYTTEWGAIAGSGGGGITTTASAPSANTIVYLDLGAAQYHELALSAGITTISCSNGNVGESHVVVINQPSSGIATVGFDTYFEFPSGAVPSMSEGGSKVDMVSFVVKKAAGAGGTELLASAGLNYQ